MRGAFLAALACALCLANRQPPSGPSRPAGHGDMILRSETCIPTRRVPTILRLRGGSVAAEEQLDRASTSAHEPATPLTVEHCDTSMDPAAGEEGKEGMEGQVRLRMAALKDVIEMQHINLVSLPENYQAQYFALHILRWPTLSHVAEAWIPGPRLGHTHEEWDSEAAEASEGPGGHWRVVGYVLATLASPEAAPPAGVPAGMTTGLPAAPLRSHVTSLAVMRSHRRRRIAQCLMLRSMHFMLRDGATSCSLHVRSFNEAAVRLYKHTLAFHVNKTETTYYADGEDAFSMHADLSPESLERVAVSLGPDLAKWALADT